MASPADQRPGAERNQAMLRQLQSEALGLSVALRTARQELELILVELRQWRLHNDGEDDMPEALVMQGALLQTECDELETRLRRARAGCAGLIPDEAWFARQQRSSGVA